MVSHAQEDQDSGLYPLFQVGEDGEKPLEVTLQVDDQPLVMKVHTGTSMSLIAQQAYEQLWPSHPLQLGILSQLSHILWRTSCSVGELCCYSVI